MDEEGGYRSSTSSSSKGEEQEELQRLKLDKQTSRVFLSGREEDIKFFVAILKSQKWYKSSAIDGQISQVSFKYPVLGQRVYDLVSINMPNQQKNDSSPISVQQQRLQIFTSKKTHYKLARMKQQSQGYNSSSLEDSLEQLRIKSNSSNTSHPSSSSVSSSNISISNSHVVNAVVEEVKQIAQVLSKQNEQNNAQMELIAKCLAQLVKQSTFMPNTIDSNHTSNIIPSSEQQIATSLSSSSSSLSQAVTVLSTNNTNQGRREQHEVVEEQPVINANNKNRCSSSNRKVSERINEMIANEGIFEYPELWKALQKEGYADSEILVAFANSSAQTDKLREIFKSIHSSSSNSASCQYPQQIYQQNQQQQQCQQFQQYPSFICQQPTREKGKAMTKAEIDIENENESNNVTMASKNATNLNTIQQNQQHEQIQYPSFIQQGQYQQQFIQEQQQQQEVIEIEDEEKNNNTQELIQLQGIQNSEINTSPQMNVAKNRERSISPLRRQQDAEQKSIDNNKKGYEQKIQKQSYSLSNNPKSKPIKSKSPNNYSPNQSRPITPQKNSKQ